MMNWAARLFGLLAALAPAAAYAAAGHGTNWGLGLQEAASPTMEHITSFHTLMLYIIGAITVFVMALLAIVILRFNKRANPTPSRTTHNTLIEVIWTAAPVLILVLVAIPSFKLLYFVDRVEDPDLTIKAVGRQWYWHYEVPEQEYKGQTIGGFAFDSYMKQDGDLKEGDIRLLSVDNPISLPVGAKVQVLVAGGDVIHNFAIPSLGLKLDAVPGRLNETWTLIKEEFAGRTFFGQCSELCGTGHAFMPIEVRAVDDAAFMAWVQKGKEEFEPLETASTPREAARLAAVRQ
ncbi:MAG: cytochrome c oxidase subunit II [Alphaproteobacteria bacterium]